MIECRCEVVFPSAVTSPVESTVRINVSAGTVTTAWDGSFACHQWNRTFGTGCPLASNAVATRRTVSPSAVMVSTGVSTFTDASSCMTATPIWPAAAPADAEMAVVPLPMAVTIPPVTVATDVSPLAHATATPRMMFPCWSLTVAVSWTVTPSALNASAVSGAMATIVGTSGGGGSGAAGSSAHAVAATAKRLSRATSRGDRVITG